MGREIERKFVVDAGLWKRPASGGVSYRQGYLSVDPERVVRIRTDSSAGFITVKGITQNNQRAEFEYSVPLADALEMLRMCLPFIIEKTRYKVLYRGHTWEVDVFEGKNDGLVTAEVELARAGEALEMPDWVGREVSGDARYFNSNLVAHPFTTWNDVRR